MTTFDVGIVGAGIHGAAVAFHLASRGASVAIVGEDRRPEVPMGASPAVPTTRTGSSAECARDSTAMFEDFRTVTGTDAGHRRTGTTTSVSSWRTPRAPGRRHRLNELGVATTLLEGERLAAALPGFDLAGRRGRVRAARGLRGPTRRDEWVVRHRRRSGATPLPGAYRHRGRAGGADTPRGARASRELDRAGGRAVDGTARRHGGSRSPADGRAARGCVVWWAGVQPVLGTRRHGRVATTRARKEHLFIVGPLLPEPQVDPDDRRAVIRPDEIERPPTRRSPRAAA